MERLTKIMFGLGYAAGYLSAAAWLFIIISVWASVSAEEIEPEFHLQSTTVIVHWYDSQKELAEALSHYTEYDESETDGYSECESRPDFNMSFCKLWLVKPTDTEDYYNFDTIGHEFYHALAGDFHDED